MSVCAGDRTNHVGTDHPAHSHVRWCTRHPAPHLARGTQHLAPVLVGENERNLHSDAVFLHLAVFQDQLVV